MARPKLIIGNWKMNMLIPEGKKLAEDIRKYSQLHVAGTDIQVAVCPPFTHLTQIEAVLKDSVVKLGAQDCHYENNGAHTGDVSASMLHSVGCTYCIIGHSERRISYGEPDRIINAKLLAALRHNMTPILCIGEKWDEKQKGKTNEVLVKQLKEGLAGVSREQVANIVIAYEPVWAISTSKDHPGGAATPSEANKTHQFIRNTIKELFAGETASNTIILYGGSVKPENARAFLTQANVDGCLVGGASLKKETFCDIIDAANIPR